LFSEQAHRLGHQHRVDARLAVAELDVLYVGRTAENLDDGQRHPLDVDRLRRRSGAERRSRVLDRLAERQRSAGGER